MGLTSVAVCGVIPVAAIGPVLLAGEYRRYDIEGHLLYIQSSTRQYSSVLVRKQYTGTETVYWYNTWTAQSKTAERRGAGQRERGRCRKKQARNLQAASRTARTTFVLECHLLFFHTFQWL
ncbi:unnamed protein product [Laminaria digitata]